MKAKDENILEISSYSYWSLFLATRRFAIPRNKVARFFGTLALPLLKISRYTSIT